MKHTSFLPALWLLAGLSAQAAEVEEFRLDNGLRVLVKPDHRAPVVMSQVWYRVGSSYETEGTTGISHVLEHMMFKGTQKHGPGEFSRLIAENGGTENAFTGTDYTAYYQQLAKDRLPIALELEADRMRNLIILDDEFAKELAVVKEERRMRTEDKPFELTQEQFNAAAYRTLPYRNPVIGWMHDLDELQPDELRTWYQRWYAPNNATLVVAGDVEPKAVFELAKQYFGAFEPQATLPIKPPGEPKQLGPNRIRVRAPAKEPYIMLGFKTPNLRKGADDGEPYALEMLLAVLSGGDSARLSRDLVRGERIATAIDADYSAYTRLPGMFTLDAIPAPGRSLPELEVAMLRQIEKLKTEPVSQEELERVRAQTKAARVYEQDSVHYQAMQIGLLETIGLDWTYVDRHVAALERVTPEQVLAVARKYLNEDNMTVAVLDPLPIESGEKMMRTALEMDHGHIR